MEPPRSALDELAEVRERPARSTPRRIATAPALAAWGAYRTRLARPGTFTFAGRELTYLHHRYGKAHAVERTVEIPLAWGVVQAHAGQRILEVGNCLAHFHAHDHDVLDKYERAPGVRNEDVVDFRPEAPYDLVLSVSTLEHVGWDEEPREPGKVRRAIEHLRGFLAPGGTLWFTVPLGYNPEVDRLVRERDLPLTDLRFLRRTSGATNRWREVGYEAARDAEYGRPYRAANAVAVGTVRAA